jgi:hypothetical protein
VEWFGQQLFVTLQNAGLVRKLIELVNVIGPDIRPENQKKSIKYKGFERLRTFPFKGVQ